MRQHFPLNEVQLEAWLIHFAGFPLFHLLNIKI